MGFLAGSFDKSVFNAGAYKSAIDGGENSSERNGYAVLRLRPDRPRLGSDTVDPEITGVMKDHLSFNIDATWTTLGQVGGSILPGGISKGYGAVGGALNIAGAASIGAAFASKKIYQQSGYLTIKPNIRVVDWNGVGQPILSAIILMYYSTPKDWLTPEDFMGAADVMLENLKPLVDVVIDKTPDVGKKIVNCVATEGLKAGKQIYNAVSNLSKKIPDNVQKEVAGAVDAGTEVVGNFVKTVAEDADDLATLRSSPVPLTVEIGQYFNRSDMIIENVEFEFSKEMTKSGPLFVDISLNLSSRKIIKNGNDMGLYRNAAALSRFSQASTTNFTGI